MLTPENRLPTGRLLKISDILDGDLTPITITRCTWRRWVKAGKAPKPINHHGSLFWRSEDIQELIDQMRGEDREAA